MISSKLPNCIVLKLGRKNFTALFIMFYSLAYNLVYKSQIDQSLSDIESNKLEGVEPR